MNVSIAIATALTIIAVAGFLFALRREVANLDKRTSSSAPAAQVDELVRMTTREELKPFQEELARLLSDLRAQTARGQLPHEGYHYNFVPMLSAADNRIDLFAFEDSRPSRSGLNPELRNVFRRRSDRQTLALNE
jgi:hypothetical protein